MHIAVCDDNIAERKQTERLLSRESDRRKAVSGILYVHSYGHQDALFRAPKQYNMFMIDMVDGDVDGLALALKLCQTGITVPIFLCVSTIDYRKAYTQLEKPPTNIHFIDKPIKVAELTKIIGQALEMQSLITPTIELRSEKETFYVKENQIVCATCNTFSTDVFLNDGRMVRIGSDLYNLYSQVCSYLSYYMISNRAFVNLDYIDKCSLFKLTLTNGKKLNISPFKIKEIKNLLA